MEAAELKKNSRVQKVVVTGCLAQRYSTELAGEHYHGCKETIGASLSDNTPTTRILSPACIAKLHGWRAPSGIDACSFASGTRPLALLFRMQCGKWLQNATCAESLPEADYIVGFQNYGSLPATLRNALQPATRRGGDAEARVQVGAFMRTTSTWLADHTYGHCGVSWTLKCMRLRGSSLYGAGQIP